MPKHNKKGRTKHGPPFVQLFKYMLKTDAWQALSAADRAVYVALADTYNGSNNGALGLGARRAGELCNISKNTATKCFRSLVEKGFIECATPGGFSRKSRHQTEWRLTTAKCDVSGKAASKAFVRWRPGSANSDHGPKIEPSRSQIRDSQTLEAA
jgi:hypothetical protein